MQQFTRTVSLLSALLSVSGVATAQGPSFTSPGMSPWSNMGQATRFTREFNPAIGFVVDAFADHLSPEAGEDGLDFALRVLELNANAYVDPKAWAYAVLLAEPGEGLSVEEAAVVYTGGEGHSTWKAGQFFVDFGKQMQTHLEDLRTLERPLVLREFLGQELPGIGVQYDNWFAAGESTPVRFSIGVFSSLLESHSHGHGGEEEEEGPEASVPGRKALDELNLTARITAMTDLGLDSQLQFGLSTRLVPEYGLEDEATGLSADGLSSAVHGADLTYGWTSETGQRTFTGGVEYLLADGDLSGEVQGAPGSETLAVLDDSASGFYAYADYVWSRTSSAGVQYSSVELLEDTSLDASELDLYYTYQFTEFRRLRFGVTLAENDESGDSERFYVQFTNYFGPHAHGLNW